MPYSKYIVIDAQIDDSIKIPTLFKNKDVISVYAWTGKPNVVSSTLVVNNSFNTYGRKSAWIAYPPMIWSDMFTEHYFIGVYPRRTITNFVADPYTLDIDNPSASDLLIATNTTGIKACDDIPVPLKFHHVLAKLTITLHYMIQEHPIPSVNSVKIFAFTTGTVDYLNQTITTIGAAREISIPATTANFTFSSVMLPQIIKKVIIQIDGKYYTYESDKGIFIGQGKRMTLPINIGPGGTLTVGNISIIDWQTITIHDTEHRAIEKNKDN